MDFRVRLPGAIYRQASEKAGDDASLARLVVAYVTAYATGTTPQQLGAAASNAGMTPEQRTERAKRAAAARWKD